MPYYDNPAGRLHDLLRRLAGQKQSESLLAAWSAVLRVDEDDVVLHLGSVADLVRQTQEAVDRAGEDALIPPVRRYRGVWARPIFPPDHAYNAQLGPVLPDGAALEALELVSAQLHAISPEGVVPDEEQLEGLKSQLRDLLDAVQAADDIPAELKHLIVMRLRDVEEAVEHIDVGGPSAIRLATEAVMGSVAFTGDIEVAKSQTVHKLWTTLLIVWTVFSAGPAIQKSIEAWHEMLPVLETQSTTHANDHRNAEAGRHRLRERPQHPASPKPPDRDRTTD